MTHEAKHKTPEDLDRSIEQQRLYDKKVKQFESELDTLEARIGSPNTPKENLHNILMDLVGRLRVNKITLFKERIYEINKKIIFLKQ